VAIPSGRVANLGRSVSTTKRFDRVLLDVTAAALEFSAIPPTSAKLNSPVFKAQQLGARTKILARRLINVGGFA